MVWQRLKYSNSVHKKEYIHCKRNCYKQNNWPLQGVVVVSKIFMYYSADLISLWSRLYIIFFNNMPDDFVNSYCLGKPFCRPWNNIDCHTTKSWSFWHAARRKEENIARKRNHIASPYDDPDYKQNMIVAKISRANICKLYLIRPFSFNLVHNGHIIVILTSQVLPKTFQSYTTSEPYSRNTRIRYIYCSTWTAKCLVWVCFLGDTLSCQSQKGGPFFAKMNDLKNSTE